MDQEKMSADGQTAPKLTPSFKIFEDAVVIWWKNLKKFVMMYVWGLVFALIPIAVGLLFLCLGQIPGLEKNLGFAIVNIIVFVVAFIFVIYFTIRSYIGMFLLVKNNYIGRERAIYEETKKWFWPYLGLTILTTIFIFLWTCLLIIPGIIFSIFYSFVTYVLLFEEKRGMAAIKRSVQLVKGYWWAVLGRFCLLGLIMWAFTVIVSIPLGLTPENTLMFSIWNAVIQVISLLIGPIALLFSYQIYQDLVKIKK